jgi:hypothetical protein
MAIGSFLGTVKSDLALLYLPSLAYGYLFYDLDPFTVNLFVATLPSDLFFQGAVLICIVGGLIYHQIFQLLFGDGGPSENPKDTTVMLKHMLTIVTYCDIRDAGDSVEDIFSNLTDEMRPRNAVRFVGIGTPVVGMFGLTYVAPFFLYNAITTGQTDSFVGSVLLIVLVIRLIQPVVWNFLPSYVPESAAEHIQTPEYRRGVEKITTDQDPAQRTIDEKWGQS